MENGICHALCRTEKRYTIVHHVGPAGLWATGRRTVYHEHAGVRRFARFPRLAHDVLAWYRPWERLFRADRCALFPVDSATVLGIRGGVVYRLGNGMAATLGRIQGDCPLLRAIAAGRSGCLYFGEYFMNPQRGVVRIFRVSADLEGLAIAHEFSAGQIRHVHGIHRDPFCSCRLWVTVGDNNGECFLYWTDDEFKSLHRTGDGSQLYRTVGLGFTESALVWGTDALDRQNCAVRLDRKSLRVDRHASFPSTVWYLATCTDGRFVAGTTVEKSPIFHARDASVWTSDDGMTWKEACRFAKDGWPMPHFKWGAISLPSGDFPSSAVWLSGEAIRGLDGKSVLVDLSHT